ncbi:MAG: hypothetical protein WBV39_00905 [Rudaea sp.]
MLVSFPLIPDTAPLARTSRESGRIIWQQRYEGIAHVAYQGGKAIAGVSGPWSDRYVLIWWDRPLAPDPLELFDSLDAAMRAVEQYAGSALRESCAMPAPKRRAGWPRAFWRRRSEIGKLDELRRRYDADTDLRGLNFCASR